MNLPVELSNIIQQWVMWYRLRRALHLAFSGLLFGLGIALGFSFAILGQSILVLTSYITLALASGLAGMGLFALVGYLWKTTLQQTTRFFDRHFHLFERTSTALELASPGDHSAHSTGLVEKQYQDALEVARQVEPGQEFFLQINRVQVGLLAALVVSLLVVGLVSRPLFAQAQARQAIQQAIEQEVEALEELKKQVQELESLTPQQRQEITKELDKAINDLQKAKTLEQAVAAMQEAESSLQELDPAAIQQQANDLQRAGQELLNEAEGQSDAPLNDFASQLSDGDLAQAAETLKDLDVSSLDTEGQEALADQLDQAASSLSQSNPELAQQLSSAAESLRQGDTEAAEQALNQAAQTLSETASEAAQASTAREVAAQVGQGSGRLVQAGQNAGGSGTQGSGQGEGENSGIEQGQGQGSGEGSSTGGDNSGTGSGAGKGSGTGSESLGGEAGSDPIDQGNGPGDGGETGYEEVFDPQRLGGSGGESVTLPPSTSMDEILGQAGTNPGEQGPSKVPYQAISPSLVDAYRKYSSSGEIPAAMRDFIKNYYYNLTQP